MYVYTSVERQDKHKKPLYYHLLGTIYMSTSIYYIEVDIYVLKVQVRQISQLLV